MITAQRHRNMGKTGDAYLRELLLVRTRLRQPQDRRYPVRRGRCPSRNGSAVAHRIQNSSKRKNKKQKYFFFLYNVFYAYSNLVFSRYVLIKCVIYAVFLFFFFSIFFPAGFVRRRRLRRTDPTNENQGQSEPNR